MSQLQKIYFKTLKERNSLVIQHIGIISEIIKKITFKLPLSMEKKDLYNIGALGLIQSANRYCIDSKIEFRHFAKQRIKGAIFDELRKQNLGGQSLRRKANQVEKAIESLQNNQNLKIEDKRIADRLGISVKKLQLWYQEIANSFVLNLDDLNSFQDIKIIKKTEDMSVEDSQIFKDRKKNLSLAIQQLSQKEQRILQLYYFQNFSFKEIGYVLNLSEARISQIHSKTLLLLKSRIKD